MNCQQLEVVHKISEWIKHNIDNMFRELPDERKSYYEKIKFRERLLDEAEKIMK
jgi:hypothetical protein